MYLYRKAKHCNYIHVITPYVRYLIILKDLIIRICGIYADMFDTRIYVILYVI